MRDPLPLAHAIAMRLLMDAADALLVVDAVGPEDAEAVIRRAEREGRHPVAVARGWDAPIEAAA